MHMLTFIEVQKIFASPHQPRQHFDEQQLASLSSSIKHLGLLQPIVVQKKGANFELIAGERRLRAAKLAGLKEIAAIVRDTALAAEEALAENLQREGLKPLEIAQALEKLARNTTQEALSQRLGIKRSTISNFLRLLLLPPCSSRSAFSRPYNDGAR